MEANRYCCLRRREEDHLMPNAISCPRCGITTEVDEDEALESCSACGERVLLPGARNHFPRAAANDCSPGAWANGRFQFSLRRMLGYVTVACVLLCLLTLFIGAISQAREAARRNQCIGQLKMLGLSMHNHFDIHNRLPLASNRPRNARPGSAHSSDLAGYSWHVATLPYQCETRLYDKLVSANPKFVRGAFEPASQPELGCMSIRLLICPTASGGDRVDNSQSEYQSYAMPQGKEALARINYMAFAASHFKNDQGLAELYDDGSSYGLVGNGMFPFPTAPSNLNHGISFKDNPDGTSQTVMLCETREAAYAAWIDGQATWVVGAWQGPSQVPGEKSAADGMLGWPDSDTDSRATIGLNPLANPSEVYLTAARYGAGHDRLWGPSSEHEGGVVNHVFADAHVQSLAPSIDRNLYLRIISRDGGETVQLD
jgi:hypothetical protein